MVARERNNFKSIHLFPELKDSTKSEENDFSATRNRIELCKRTRDSKEYNLLADCTKKTADSTDFFQHLWSALEEKNYDRNHAGRCLFR